MNTASTAFTPPSPGAWELEQTHLTRPPSMFSASVIPDSMMAGFKAGTRHYGLLLDHLEVAVINRFIYYAPRAVGAPKSAKGAPPRLLFEILRRVHPEIRRRVRRAEAVFRDRLWREDVAQWDREFRPAVRGTGTHAPGGRRHSSDRCGAGRARRAARPTCCATRYLSITG